jgi:hypothetical protein
MSGAQLGSISIKPRTPLPANDEKEESEDELESCPVCIEVFTSTGSQKKVSCPYCAYAVCRGCTERFLTDMNLCQDSKCMKCLKAWTTGFIHSTFTKVFYLGGLKNHRAEVLRQRETSLLPGTQVVIEMQDKMKHEDDDLKKEKENLDAEMERIEQRLWEIKTRRAQIRYARKTGDMDIKMEQAERKVFVRACPAANCKGFLSQKWKCGICDIWVCSACHAIKGDREDSEHKCNEDDVKSAELIMKDTKACPCCGVRIFKTFGCNQFWCTHCHNAFDWSTLKKLDATRIHNPYYFDYLSKNGQNQNAAPNPLGGCDNLDSVALRYAGGNKCVKIGVELAEIMRFRNELIERVDQYPRPDNIDRNIDLRIKFMKNEIDEKRFASTLQQRDKKNNRLYSEGDILRMFSDVSLEHLLYAQNNSKSPTEVKLAHRRLYDLKDYTNNSLLELSRQYNNICVAIMIDHTGWYVSNTDRLQGKVKKAKKQAQDEDSEVE